MAKTWGDYDAVAHAWAHGLDGPTKAGRQPGAFRPRMYREGHYGSDVLWSYGSHYAVGRIVTLDNGERVALLNSDRRSMTTGKHLDAARDAVRHLSILYVESPQNNPTRADVEAHLNAAAEHHAKAKRCRAEWSIGHEQSKAAHHLGQARQLNALFGLGVTIPDDLAEIAAALEENRKQREEAERKEREAAFAQKLLALSYWRRTGNTAARFEDGTTSYAPRMDPQGYAFVRRDGNELQTSMGARVPWEHAVRVFRFVATVRRAGRTWTPDGHSLRVGAFTVDRINPDGSFRAGCHSFRWEEIVALAVAEGVDMGATGAAGDHLEPVILAV